MKQIKRLSEYPLATSIIKSSTVREGTLRVIPDGGWDMMIVKQNGKTTVLLMNGPMLQSQLVPYVANTESLVITFAAHTYMTQGQFAQKGIHVLPTIANQAMKLGPETLEIPTFENAEVFIKKLHQKHLLVSDKVVQYAINRNHLPVFSDRTIQRHFKKVTGMTFSYYQQIQRAKEAYAKLQQGNAAINVAYDVGYSDQFHMSHSLKRILGQTPTEILQRS